MAVVQKWCASVWGRAMDDEDAAESAKRLQVLEDNAWLALSTAGGLRYVLNNLLLELQRKGILDMALFVRHLQAHVAEIPTPSIRLGAEAVLIELHKEASLPDVDTSGRAPPETGLH